MLLPVLLVMAAAAVGVFMPYRRVVVAWAGELVSWEGDGAVVKIGHPAALAVVFGGLAFWGAGTIASGGGSPAEGPAFVEAPANPVDWQNNWLTFSDTAPNDSIWGVEGGGDAQNQADSAALYDFGALINFTSGVPEGSTRDTMSVLKPVADIPGNWPTGMGHVIRIKISGQFTANQYAVDTLALPDSSQYQFRRHYIMMVADSGFNPADLHYFHHGDNYATWLDLNVLETAGVVTGDSLYRIRYLQNVNEPSSSGALGYINADSVKTHTVYMVETREQAVSSSQIRTLMRMYRVDGGGTHTLWKDTADFRWECLNNGTTDCNGLTNYWELPVYIDSIGEHFRRIEYGVNGSDPQPNLGDRWMFVGGVASRVSGTADDWIGPFCTPSNEC